MPKIELKNGKYVDDQMADGVPKGGTSGQVLKKNSNNDYDLVWDTGGSSTIPTLQDVTTAGNVTEDNIRVKDSAFPTDYVEITSNSVNFNSSLGSTSLSCYPVGTGNVVLLPIQSGTTALTVNGVSADSNGDVVIPVGTGTVTSITVSSPLTGGTITTTGTISIPKATGSVDGYLSSIDWSVFNSKEPAISAGTTSQYWRGDKTWQTFPTIPTVGTWGALNYPTWTSGTPFVKMTAVGTFSLDTNTYLTSITSSDVTTALGYTPYNSTNPSGYITSNDTDYEYLMMTSFRTTYNY